MECQLRGGRADEEDELATAADAKEVDVELHFSRKRFNGRLVVQTVPETTT